MTEFEGVAVVVSEQEVAARQAIAESVGKLVFGDNRSPNDSLYQAEPSDSTMEEARAMAGGDNNLYLIIHGVLRSRAAWAGSRVSGSTFGVLYDGSRLEFAESVERLYRASAVNQQDELAILTAQLPNGYVNWVQTNGRL